LLLAPPGKIHWAGGAVQQNPDRYEQYLCQLQQLRGRCYAEDNAITFSDIDSDGRHRQEEDERSWHLLRVDGTQVVAAARFCHYPSDVLPCDLACFTAPLARSRLWGPTFFDALTTVVWKARKYNFSLAELGGFVVASSHRGSAEALYILLGLYRLGQLLGGTIAITTATFRHSSASILKKVGGVPLTGFGRALPPYYDPRYRCDMELLSFNSEEPNAKYHSLIQKYGREFSAAEVLQR
jgi:hypothetical protein